MQSAPQRNDLFTFATCSVSAAPHPPFPTHAVVPAVASATFPLCSFSPHLLSLIPRTRRRSPFFPSVSLPHPISLLPRVAEEEEEEGGGLIRGAFFPFKRRSKPHWFTETPPFALPSPRGYYRDRQRKSRPLQGTHAVTRAHGRTRIRA